MVAECKMSEGELLARIEEVTGRSGLKLAVSKYHGYKGGSISVTHEVGDWSYTLVVGVTYVCGTIPRLDEHYGRMRDFGVTLELMKDFEDFFR